MQCAWYSAARLNECSSTGGRQVSAKLVAQHLKTSQTGTESADTRVPRCLAAWGLLAEQPQDCDAVAVSTSEDAANTAFCASGDCEAAAGQHKPQFPAEQPSAYSRKGTGGSH
jgi:hypothetical protein